MNRRGFFGRLLGAAVAATIPLAEKKENDEPYQIVVGDTVVRGRGDIEVYSWGAGGGGGSGNMMGGAGGGAGALIIHEWKEK